jgi:hypothetical protein
MCWRFSLERIVRVSTVGEGSVVMSDAARSNRWKPTFYVLIEDNAAEEWLSPSQYLEVVVTKCR